MRISGRWCNCMSKQNPKKHVIINQFLFCVLCSFCQFCAKVNAGNITSLLNIKFEELRNNIILRTALNVLFWVSVNTGAVFYSHINLILNTGRSFVLTWNRFSKLIITEQRIVGEPCLTPSPAKQQKCR